MFETLRTKCAFEERNILAKDRKQTQTK